MRTKFTLFLIFINVALFYTIFYLRTEQNRVQPDINLVLGPESADLTELVIEASSGGTIHLVRRDAQWVLTQPLVWNANEFAVRFILNELNSLRAETTFPVAGLAASGQTLADYGLEKPRIRLTLTPAGAKPITLQIGDATQGGNRLYVLSADGTQIHVVNRSLAERLTMGLTDLRAQTLFNIPVFEAQALTLETEGGQRTLLRREGARWNIETLRTAANRVDTELVLGALTGLEVQAFPTREVANSALQAFASPELRITLEGNGRRQTLLLAAPAPSASDAPAQDGLNSYYARMEGDPNREGTVFTVALPQELLQTLRHAQRDLREKRILDFDTQRVSSINLQGADGEVTLQRLDDAAGGWQVVTRGGDQALESVRAENEVVARLLSDLARLSADEFTNDAPSQADREAYGFVRPTRRVTIETRGTDGAVEPVVLLIATGADHRTYAGLSNREPIFRVSSEILNETPLNPLAYRDRTVRELPAGAQLVHLKVTALADGSALLDQDLPSADSKVSAAAEKLRLVRGASLLGDFTPTGPLVDGVERPWEHKLEVTLALAGAAGEKATYALFLAPRTGGDIWIAGAPAENLNFTLEPDLVDALFAITFGSRDPGPPSSVPSESAAR